MTTEDKITKEFDDIFDNRSEAEAMQKAEFRQFILEALQQQRKDLIQNEKAVKEMLDDAEIDAFKADLIEKIEKLNDAVERNIYIDDIISIIKE